MCNNYSPGPNGESSRFSIIQPIPSSGRDFQNQGPGLQCLLKVKEDLVKYWYFNILYWMLKNGLDRCNTCGQRFHCDLQAK